MGVIFINIESESNGFQEGAQPPVRDSLTLRLCAAIHAGVWVGQMDHLDACPYCMAQAFSSTCILRSGENMVGPLALHIIACHRDMVPQLERDMVTDLTDGEHIPTDEELLL